MCDSKDEQINQTKLSVSFIVFPYATAVTRCPSDAGFLFHEVSVLREVIRNRLYGFVSVINYTIDT